MPPVLPSWEEVVLPFQPLYRAQVTEDHVCRILGLRHASDGHLLDMVVERRSAGWRRKVRLEYLALSIADWKPISSVKYLKHASENHMLVGKRIRLVGSPEFLNEDAGAMPFGCIHIPDQIADPVRRIRFALPKKIAKLAKGSMRIVELGFEKSLGKLILLDLTTSELHIVSY